MKVSSSVKRNPEISPVFYPIEKPFLEEFGSSIQRNTTNESYSITEKVNFDYTTSNKKIKSSFEEINSNGNVEINGGNVIEFEEFNPIIRENANTTGQFGKNFEEIRKKNDNSLNFVKEIEKNNEFLLRENEDLKKKLMNKEKETENLRENLMKFEKIPSLSKKNEELLKEILMLKENLIEMNQNCKDSDIENIKLKEEIDNRVIILMNLKEKIVEKGRKIRDFY